MSGLSERVFLTPETCHLRPLVKPSLPPKLRIVALEHRLLGDFYRLLARREYAFFVASDLFMRVQAFEHELRRRDLPLGTVFRVHVQLAEFFHETLNLVQSCEHILCRGVVAELNFAAQVEP